MGWRGINSISNGHISYKLINSKCTDSLIQDTALDCRWTTTVEYRYLEPPTKQTKKKIVYCCAVFLFHAKEMLCFFGQSKYPKQIRLRSHLVPENGS